MKRVVITGAGRGIGKATAEKFAEKGWEVIGTSTTGKNAKISLDLANSSSITQAAKQIKQQYGMIDILINNAAIAPEPDTDDIDMDLLRQILAAKLVDRRITVASVDPGWVKTDMGGSSAPRQATQPANEIFDLATSKYQTGQFWLAGKIRPW